MPIGKKKVLITGAKGQLGQEVTKEFSNGGTYDVIAAGQSNLDITNNSQVLKFFKAKKPGFVVHCAAWTDVEAAANNPKAAVKVNAQGTKNICEAAKAVGTKVFYISTNEVFDGFKKTPYLETDKPNPQNPYAKSKLEGERYCQQILGDKCTIIRSSWLYGPASKNNFPNKILAKVEEGGQLKVVDDEIAVPTYTPDLAEAIRKLVDIESSGIFHLVNEGQASRYDWAREILKLKKSKVEIERIKLRDFKRVSKPPRYSVLKNSRALEFAIKLRNWKSANKEYLKNLHDL